MTLLCYLTFFNKQPVNKVSDFSKITIEDNRLLLITTEKLGNFEVLIKLLIETIEKIDISCCFIVVLFNEGSKVETPKKCTATINLAAGIIQC